MLRQKPDSPSSCTMIHGVKTMGLCLKGRSPQGPHPPKKRCAGIPAVWLSSGYPIWAFGMVSLPLQATYDSSSPDNSGQFFSSCAQHPKLSLPGAAWDSAIFSNMDACTRSKQEQSSKEHLKRHPSLCESRSTRTYSYPTCTTS